MLAYLGGSALLAGASVVFGVGSRLPWGGRAYLGADLTCSGEACLLRYGAGLFSRGPDLLRGGHRVSRGGPDIL